MKKEDKIIFDYAGHWWNVPLYFHWGMKEICPFIWFGWWLITFEPFNIAFQPD